MTRLNDEDWETLEDIYEQANLYDAIQGLEQASRLLEYDPVQDDHEGGSLRAQLHRLQKLAQQVIEGEQRDQVDELLMLAADVDMQIFKLQQEIEEVQEIVEQFAEFQPGEDDE